MRNGDKWIAGWFAAFAMMLCTMNAFAQSSTGDPHMGYLFPSGAQQGTKIEVVVGGQGLRGVQSILISGHGVSGRILQHYRPFNPDREEREAILTRMKAAVDKRLSDLPGGGKLIKAAVAQRSGSRTFRRGAASEGKAGKAAASKPDANSANAKKTDGKEAKAKLAPIDHPLLHNLESKTLPELRHVFVELLSFRKKQPNAQIAESVLVELTVDPGAALGDREVRLVTPSGLTNPMIFQVGQLPEDKELEPNEEKPAAIELVPEVGKIQPRSLPVVFNGQIKPGDVDRFRFNARAGQQLVVEVQARHLIPYLADAVPGWFQATVALLDEAGNELAYADDYNFNPDPVLFYRIPREGVYQLEIRDSIFRGREDFVYRVSVSERPFITSIFPLGAKAGDPAELTVGGWNLKSSGMTIDTQAAQPVVRHATVRQGALESNDVAYAVDVLPEAMESEPNDAQPAAQAVQMSMVFNGRVDKPGDIDFVRFEGKAGQQLKAEIIARRLNSPVDSLVRLLDSGGNIIAWNDDVEDKGSGLITHHADSRLVFTLPSDGVYGIQVSDSQGKGGPEYAYRLRLSAPEPDFELRVTPSSINSTVNRSVAIQVHAIRKDGFTGPIEVALKNAPKGLVLNGGLIPANSNQVRMTLTPTSSVKALPVVFEGRAQVNGAEVVHAAIPAEDMMQAFLPRHLVPSQQLLVCTREMRLPAPRVQIANAVPLSLAPGGTASVQVKALRGEMLSRMEWELKEPPEGLTLAEVKPTRSGVELVLQAGQQMKDIRDNLIIEGFADPSALAGASKNNSKLSGGRRSFGVLPAIPVQLALK